MITTMARKKVRKLWSTGQIAELVGVNPKTVAQWIDGGEMAGVKLPGLVERRVHRQELRSFLAKFEYEWALREMDQEEGINQTPPPAPTRKRKA